MSADILMYHGRLLVAVFFLVVCTIGIGIRFIQLFSKKEDYSHLFSLTVSFFLGQTFLSTVSFVVNVLFQLPLNSIVLFLVLCCGFFPGLKSLRVRISTPFSHSSLIDKFLWLFLIVILGFHGLYSFHKPSEWDEIAYHVPVMKELAQGRAHFPLLSNSPYLDFYQPFSQFYGSLPYNSEAYAAIGYLLSGGHASSAHLIYFANFVFFLGFVSFFISFLYKTPQINNLIVAILLSTNFSLVLLLSSGLIDINASIYQFLALSLLLLARKTKKLAYVYFSALCMGNALGQKFTTAYLLPLYLPLAFIVANHLEKSKSWILKFILLVIIGGGGWYLKNLIVHFNPVYPLYIGHSGMTEAEYTFLIDTLIAGIRIPITLENVLNTLKINYIHETGTLLMGSLLALAIILKKIRLHWYDRVLLLFAVFFYSVNFLFGSQISRYVLLTPLIIHIVSARLLNRNLFLATIIVCITLFAIKHDTLQWSIWNARLSHLPKIFNHEKSISDPTQIGCVAEVYRYCQNNCPQNTKVLNFWDAYAAVYFQDIPFFYNFKGLMKLDTSTIPPEVRYLYVNTQWRKDISASNFLHRDMKPSQRESLEKALIEGKSPVFESGNCQLYKV